jgi:ParB-like chromosome segregation protein Spo0J
MKIKVKDLKPNPFRNMEKYPIDPIKVRALINSIKETEFWDNLLAREIDGEIQIAYGHHRLIALQELKIEKIDIPVKALDDSTMLRIMANENMDQWNDSVAVISETVRATRDYLNAELAKYESWEELEKYPNNSIKVLFTGTKGDFQKVKKYGVGQGTIKKFLGENWTQTRIQKALELLNDEEIEFEAFEAFEPSKNSTKVAHDFRNAVKKINEKSPNKIPKKETVELAKKIQKKMTDLKVSPSNTPKRTPTMETMVFQEINQEDEFDATIHDLTLEIENITTDARRLTNKMQTFNGRLQSMNVEKLEGMGKLFAITQFRELLQTINTTANYFDIQFNDLKINNDEK